MKTFAVLLTCSFLAAMITTASAADKLQHVVCFKFKSTATAQDIKTVEDAFQALKQKIPLIQSLEWGTNLSKENKDKGFTHCFILTFKSDKDCEAYVVHPDHKAFGKIVRPLLEDVFVMDFWARQ